MCGLVGFLYNQPGKLPQVVQNLSLVNHRGHEAVGIAASNRESISIFRKTGYVREACTLKREAWRQFAKEVTESGATNFVGHTRYSTVGPSDVSLAQPMHMINPHWHEFVLAHNGQLTDHERWRVILESQGHRFQTTSDTEVLAALLAHSQTSSLPDAVAEAVETLSAAFSLIVMNQEWLVGARDRWGLRPLWFTDTPKAVGFASEIAALPGDRAYKREVPPGTVIAVRRTGASWEVIERKVAQTDERYCIFEALYFARPDQVIGTKTAGEIRYGLGQRLAREHPLEVDLVCGAPDSGTDAAMGFANEAGLPFTHRAVLKNWYTVPARSFILPGQEKRIGAAHAKYSICPDLVRGKRVVCVDDTLVRGNTTPILTEKFRQAGAREVHWRIAAAPIRYPCFYGIDIPSQKELPAASHTEEELGRQLLKADSLKYLSLEGMRSGVNGGVKGWCNACFTGRYPTPVPQTS